MGKHGTPVKKDKLKAIFAELDKTAKDLGVADYKHRRRAEDHRRRSQEPSRRRREKKPIKVAPFAEGLAMVGLDKDLAAGKPIAPRKAYGAALVALGAADKRDRRPRRRREELHARRVVRQEVPGAVPRVQDRRAEHVLGGGGPQRRGEDPVHQHVRQVAIGFRGGGGIYIYIFFFFFLKKKKKVSRSAYAECGRMGRSPGVGRKPSLLEKQLPGLINQLIVSSVRRPVVPARSSRGGRKRLIDAWKGLRNLMAHAETLTRGSTSHRPHHVGPCATEPAGVRRQ